MAESGHVQDEMALIGKYRAGFTGDVPKSFSQPSPLEIKPAFTNTDYVSKSYGYTSQESHPTPTDPNKP